MTKLKPYPIEEDVAAFFEAEQRLELDKRHAQQRRVELAKRICLLFGRGNYENGRNLVLDLLAEHRTRASGGP